MWFSLFTRFWVLTLAARQLANNKESFQGVVRTLLHTNPIDVEVMVDELKELVPVPHEKANWTVATTMLSCLADGGQMVPLDLLDRFFTESTYPVSDKYLDSLGPAIVREHAHDLLGCAIRLADVYLLNNIMLRLSRTGNVKEMILFNQRNAPFGRFNKMIQRVDFSDDEVMQVVKMPSLVYFLVTKGHYQQVFQVLQDKSIDIHYDSLKKLEEGNLLALWLENISTERFPLQSALLNAVDVIKMIDTGNIRLAHQLFRFLSLDSIKNRIKKSGLRGVSLEKAFHALSLEDDAVRTSYLDTIDRWHEEYLLNTNSSANNSGSSSNSSAISSSTSATTSSSSATTSSSSATTSTASATTSTISATTASTPVITMSATTISSSDAPTTSVTPSRTRPSAATRVRGSRSRRNERISRFATVGSDDSEEEEEDDDEQVQRGQEQDDDEEEKVDEFKWNRGKKRDLDSSGISDKRHKRQ